MANHPPFKPSMEVVEAAKRAVAPSVEPHVSVLENIAPVVSAYGQVTVAAVASIAPRLKAIEPFVTSSGKADTRNDTVQEAIGERIQGLLATLGYRAAARKTEWVIADAVRFTPEAHREISRRLAPANPSTELMSHLLTDLRAYAAQNVSGAWGKLVQHNDGRLAVEPPSAG